MIISNVLLFLLWSIKYPLVKNLELSIDKEENKRTYEELEDY